jgi:ABC-2 type transport system permease protein
MLLNVWAFPLSGLRLDLTAQREYTLSQTTRDLLGNLQEPLLIRGYFSEKTHPLLSPLIPSIRDMLQEYEAASRGRVQLEIIDPAKDPDKEAEANQTYGIRPTPFQVAGRYETSIINSYFDILIRYGDQNVVVNFRDLIEVESRPDGVDVRLRNLEYDLTSAMKKVVHGFQSAEAVLATLDEPARLTLYLTPNTLPESLADVPATIEKVAQDIATESNHKLIYALVDPDAPGSSITRQELFDLHGLRPFATSLFSGESYYLHMVLEVGDQAQVIYPSGELSEADVRLAIESTLKRASPGFLQVVGLWIPPAEATQDPYGQMQGSLSSWQELTESLRQEYEVRSMDLSTGQVPADVDVLVIVAPQGMTDKDRFAIDQYLMRGGSVVVAAGNHGITADQLSGWLALRPLEDGLQEMLSDYGIEVERSLVMDLQNEPFPVSVTRNAGGFQVQEIQALQYPFFVDIRPDGMASDSPIASNLPAVTLNWASPITTDEQKNADRLVTELLRSSPASWTQVDTTIQPDLNLYPDLGFPAGEDMKPYTLAVSVQGVFESAFKGKPSPLTEGDTGEGAGAPQEPASATDSSTSALGTIEVSPETARLVVIGSAEFVDDVVLDISSRLTRDRYLNNLKLMQNTVAWAVEDLDLLDIRSRGTYARVLAPMTEREQSFWESANYAAALVGLALIAILWNARRKNQQPMELMERSAISTLAEKQP